jgi:hypothetical protein
MLRAVGTAAEKSVEERPQLELPSCEKKLARIWL